MGDLTDDELSVLLSALDERVDYACHYPYEFTETEQESLSSLYRKVHSEARKRLIIY